MDSPAFPLGSHLGEEDLNFQRCPAEGPSKGADCERVEAFDVVCVGELHSQWTCQLYIYSATKTPTPAYLSNLLQHRVLRPRIRRAFINLLHYILKPGFLHPLLICVDGGDRAAEFAAGFDEEFAPLTSAAVRWGSVVVAVE